MVPDVIFLLMAVAASLISFLCSSFEIRIAPFAALSAMLCTGGISCPDLLCFPLHECGSVMMLKPVGLFVVDSAPLIDARRRCRHLKAVVSDIPSLLEAFRRVSPSSIVWMYGSMMVFLCSPCNAVFVVSPNDRLQSLQRYCCVSL